MGINHQKNDQKTVYIVIGGAVNMQLVFWDLNCKATYYIKRDQSQKKTIQNTLYSHGRCCEYAVGLLGPYLSGHVSDK